MRWRGARLLPGLAVGLHLVLVDGDSLLGHRALPQITGADGKFPRRQLGLALRYGFSPAARRELAAEMRAQFAAYAATGLTLHHADAHKHMQMHPVVAWLMMRIGREYGLTRIRAPAEPPAVLRACGTAPSVADWALYGWARLLRAWLRRRRFETSDYVFGIKWSGHMTAARVRGLLARLPAGESEIYFHPAVRPDAVLARLMPEYQHEAEFAALLELGEGRQGPPAARATGPRPH